MAKLSKEDPAKASRFTPAVIILNVSLQCGTSQSSRVAPNATIPIKSKNILRLKVIIWLAQNADIQNPHILKTSKNIKRRS